MQIVIDIPDEDFKIMKHNIAIDNPLCPLRQEEIVAIIVNGTPLPKGHGDQIDRKEAEKIADKMFEHITSPLLNHIQTYDAYNIIRTTPTVIEADVEDDAEDLDNLDLMLEYLWNDTESEDKSDLSLCDSCINTGCILQTGIIRNHCDFYKGGKRG